MELEFFIKPDEVIEAISGNVAEVQGKTSNNQHPTTNIQFPALNPQSSTLKPNWGWEAGTSIGSRSASHFTKHRPVRTTLEEYWQKPEELAHYARACVDILFKFPFGHAGT